MLVQHFYDEPTFTLTYVVYDATTKDAVIIDPVLDFDQASGKVSDESFKLVEKFIADNKLNLHAVLETHAHADHLSSSQIFKRIYPAVKIGIGERIKIVQETFKAHFNIDYLKADGSQFDLLFKDFEEVNFGSLKMQAIPTPGHTPACMSFKFGNMIFTGDALFMPDYGTGRCDFPKGSAKDLYHSIHKNLYALSDDTVVYVGHDYSPNGREMRYMTTIGESKVNNIQLKASTSEAEYVEFREARDKTLAAPRLLLPSVQINIDGGKLPPKESNGASYLKLPLNNQTPFKDL
jgi:glyoxylase-like metal-dependent hydrolase (beta-lactamase superfamily II)